MPRTNIDPHDASAQDAVWSDVGIALTETAADAANLNETAACGRLMIIARNAGGSTRNVVVSSSPDSKYGRSGDATVALAAGALWSQVIVRDGWVQTDDKFWFEAAHADVKFSLIKLVE